METIKWSKSQISSEFQSCEKLADVIVQVEKHLQQSQQVVCQIKVNDLLFTDSDERKFADTKRDDIDSLEISFRTSDFLLRDSAQSLIAWIGELQTSVIKTAEVFRANKPGTTNYPFFRVISNTEWLIEALQAVKGHIAIDQAWVDCESRLVATLKELETGFRTHDNILVADVLEYEVSMVLDQWREILSKVAAS